MVLTAAQTTAFFTGPAQMALSARTYNQLATEGITSVEDLSEFEDADFKQLAYNLSHPPATLRAAPAAVAGGPAGPAVLVPTEPFVLGAKSLCHLKIAAQAVRYYESVQRPLTAGSMDFATTLRNFDTQWKALEEKIERDAPSVPKITKNVKVTSWVESFRDHLNQVYGVRNTPLAYVIRDDENVALPAPRLLNNQPHSADHGSIEGELIARISHTHATFRDDNQLVYEVLEAATRSTIYAASISPFQRAKNGRAAHKALVDQHAGQDKWEAELKWQENFMKTRVWKGNSNQSLEKFVEQHRAANIALQRCAQHIAYQLPNEHTRVRYLLDNIQCGDADVKAALSSIRLDTAGPNAMRNNFEAAVAFLLPVDPVARKRKEKGNRNGNATISSVGGATKGVKPSKGKSGVEFRYYKTAEYEKLNDDQKLELREWRKTQPDHHSHSGSKRKIDNDTTKNDSKRNKSWRKEIAAVFKEEQKKLEKTRAEEQSQLNEIKGLLSSVNLRGNSPAKQAKDNDTATVIATKLQGILKRNTTPGDSSD